MITEPAVVIRCRDGFAEVEVRRQSACGHCELARGCGTGAIGRLLGNRGKTLSIATDRRLEPGDEITLGMAESAVVRASFLLYGLPLIGLLACAVMTEAAALPEWAVVLTSFAGLWLGFEIAGRIGRTLLRNSFTVDIIGVRMNPASLPES